MQHHQIKLKSLTIANDLPFTLIAGPCQMESRDHALMMSESIKKIAEKYGVNFIYKTSYDKANRTSLHGKRGMGLEASISVFEEIRRECDLPVLTDVHTQEQCEMIAPHVDVIQIPAFLCRQTDLLVAAAKTGKVINVKKGQFLAPWDMKNVANKMIETGNKDVMLCERGVSFGYNNLVNDFKALPIMAETGQPVVFDATHSVQQPGGLGAASGGKRQFVPYLAKAALAIGVAALFMEVHQDPDHAPSDGPNMIPLNELDSLLRTLQKYDQITKEMM